MTEKIARQIQVVYIFGSFLELLTDLTVQTAFAKMRAQPHFLARDFSLVSPDFAVTRSAIIRICPDDLRVRCGI
jgi:hypothetical protein